MIVKYKMVQFIFLLVIHTFILAQISVGGDAELRFGESKNNYNFSEILLNMNITNDDLATWFQFEYSDPPELGLNMNGLRKFRVDYTSGPLELSVGDIYKIWGRGLILNQFDDQNVNLDNGYRGLSFGLIDDGYALNFISGLSNIARISTDFYKNIDPEGRKPNHSVNHSLFGGDLEFFRERLNIALSFLQSRESHPMNNPLTLEVDTLNIVHRTHGLRGGYEGTSISGYVEYANKLTLLPELNINNIYQDYFNPHNGFSLFANVNYYFSMPPFDGWSMTMEYKNYNTTKINPDERNNFVKNYDMNLIYTQPPTAIREHSSVLLARLIPQVNFSDEVGYQLSLVGPVSNLGYFTLNYQAASRTSLWEKEYSDSINAVLSSKWASDSSVTMMPYTSDVSFPYNELYIEMEGYIKNLRYQLGLAWTNNITEYHALYNSGQNGIWDIQEPFTDNNDNGAWDDGESYTDYYSIVNERLENKYQNAFTIPTILTYKLRDGWSIDLKYEFQSLQKGTSYTYSLSSDEVFTDLDGDGVWDAAEEFADLDGDGVWDDAEENWYYWWLNGWIPDDQLSNYDTNGNGVYDPGEQFTDLDDDGVWDDAEEFTDLDGDGVWDDAEDFDDLNLDDVWTVNGVYVDSNKTSFYVLDNETDQKFSEEFQNNHMITLGLGKSPYWSISLTVESSSAYEYGPQLVSITNPMEKFIGNFIDLDNKWIALDMMININENTRLDIMYGTLRGGIICSNGICRYVEPFDDGFKLSLTSVF